MRIFNEIWAATVIFSLCSFGTAFAQSFSQPTYRDTDEMGRLRSLLDEAIGYSLQNPPSKFDYPPMEVLASGLYEELDWSTVSRWSLGWDESEWSGYIRNLERVRLGTPRGIDQQPVDPEKAIGTYRAPEIYGGKNWNGRVANWELTKRNAGLKTCKAAIGALYIRACKDPGSCDIEAEYESICVKRHLQAKYAQSCVAVVKDYGNSCFGGPGLEGLYYRDISGGGTPERPLCNVASFLHRNAIAFATAEHCLPEDGSDLESRFHRTTLEMASFSRSEDKPFGVRGDFTFLESDEAPMHFSHLHAMKAAKAEEFAPTIFAGNNSLGFLANKVIEINGLQADPIGLYWVDSSPLCTIVDYDEANGEMLHTCQTSNGGSGGMLIQKHENDFVVVGINTGPSTDDKNVTNIAQFASGSAFDD